MSLNNAFRKLNSYSDTFGTGRAVKKIFKYVLQDLLREKPFWWNRTRLKKDLELFKLDSSRKIKIVFLIHLPSSWTALKSVYESCLINKKLEPVIILTPRRKNRFSDKWEGLEESEAYFKSQNITYEISCSSNYLEWLDLKDLKPDIVFIQTPYEDQRHKIYKIGRLSKFTRVCYVPYAFIITAGTFERDFYGTYFHKDCWRIYAESEYHREKFISYCESSRVVVTGYPKFDAYKDLTTTGSCKNRPRTILWAAHWTIEDEHFNASTFLKNYKYFLKLARENLDIKIIFRPHPFLFQNLIEGKHLSEEQLREFISEWTSFQNTEIDKNPNYFEVFIKTDILITDNGSFLGEYLLTGNPVIYTHNYIDNSFNLNDYGVSLTKYHYIATTVAELEILVEDIFFKKNDYLKELRVNNSLKFIYSPPEKAGSLIIESIVNDFT